MPAPEDAIQALDLYRQILWERYYAPWLGKRPPAPDQAHQYTIHHRRRILLGDSHDGRTRDA